MKTKLGWKKRLLVIFGILISGTMVIFAILLLTMEKPPIAEFKSCLELLAKAKRASADVYASEYYQAADRKYQSALWQWRIENEKIFFLRNYSKTKELILTATLKAQEALVSSGENKDSLKLNYLKEAELLKQKLDNYHDLFIQLPLKNNVRKNYEFGKFALEEGLSAFGRGDIMLASKKLNQGKAKIVVADKEVNTLLKEYFGYYPKWQNWFSLTVRQSVQNNNYAFIVDKIKHKGYLYFKGKVVKEYDVELGRNWIGDKYYAGDKATPEGMYKITKKKSTGNSGYYKALLINYPNEEDLAAFNAKKRQGVISKNTKIGSLIEIHGEGGKGGDWTSGCVALTNTDIDELFNKVSVGTPVTIIGSIKTLSELLN